MPEARWAGAMVPKRHARRAATRSLLKRQIREALRRHEATLLPGLWLVRLRRPVERDDFISAQSNRLAAAMRAELDLLLASRRPAATGLRPDRALQAGVAAATGRAGRRRGAR